MSEKGRGKTMRIKVVLFDLDGTLLPMNQDKFIEKYFINLTEYMCKNGEHEPSSYTKAIWSGVKAMLLNDNSITNEEAYFETLGKIYGEECVKSEYPKYEKFYLTKYLEGKSESWYTPNSKKLVDSLKKKGIRVALATNPVFPSSATNARMGWVDLHPEDFELVTTCDNTGYSKPNPKYYLEIAEKLKVDPRECLMVGNDVDDDMPARQTGMEVFLLTDCLINKNGRDVSEFPSGGFDELVAYIDEKI